MYVFPVCFDVCFSCMFVCMFSQYVLMLCFLAQYVFDDVVLFVCLFGLGLGRCCCFVLFIYILSRNVLGDAYVSCFSQSHHIWNIYFSKSIWLVMRGIKERSHDKRFPCSREEEDELNQKWTMRFLPDALTAGFWWIHLPHFYKSSCRKQMGTRWVE